MTEQQEIAGIQPVKCKVAHKRAFQILQDTASHSALKLAMAELEHAQKQHPSVAGLTLAIAVIARRAAEAQADMTRQVLTVAAHNRMPVEEHAMALRFEDDGMWIEAVGEGTGTEHAHE